MRVFSGTGQPVRSIPSLAIGVFVGKGCASAGVDIQAAQGAPGGEFCRIDYCPHNGPTGGELLCLKLLCELFPSLEISRKHVCIVHDPENSRIIAFAVPRDSKAADASKPIHSGVPFMQDRVDRQAVVGRNRLPPLRIRQGACPVQTVTPVVHAADGPADPADRGGA